MPRRGCAESARHGEDAQLPRRKTYCGAAWDTNLIMRREGLHCHRADAPNTESRDAPAGSRGERDMKNTRSEVAPPTRRFRRSAKPGVCERGLGGCPMTRIVR